jgi:LuxR family transcriptional regulator, maltose regulon positive regulatory protein
LTLVVAPAGYGKTVAVELWLAERGHAAAWVRADARDDDAMRLWSSLATAVERVRPGAGADALAQLREPAGVVLPVIEALASGLAADGRPIVLVVDDVQSIGDARCLRSLNDAVASLPENVQLVLISRTLPPLRLARLRTQGQIVEVGADDLAFTVDEAQQLFAAVPGVSADDATIAALTGRTEGWAGVLYLAALWLRERGDPGVALRTFRGSQRDITAYFAGEVLGDLRPDAREFLQRTAVLPQLCGELCDAVLRQSGSRDRLRALERANRLVIPLADRPGWFRYHALLRDHLLGEVDRADAAAMRRRALTWSRDHGLVEDAAEYARAVGDIGALLELIEDHALDLIRVGRSRTIVRWTTAIPRAELLASPRALVAGIGAAHVSGRPAAEIRRMLVLARAADPHLVSPYEGAMLQIARALYTDDHVGEALREAQTAVEISRADDELLVPALGIRALVRLLAGDEAQAAADARAAIEHPDAARRPYGYIAAEATLAIIDARAGRRHSARGHADGALREMRRAGLSGLPAGVGAPLADAVTAALEGRLSGAGRAARQAAAAAIAGGVWQAWALLELARIELRRGRRVVAEDVLAHAQELLGAARDAGALPALADALRGELDAAISGAPGPAAEPLSPAELAVLRLLPGRTVREIAEALYLSANTIKSHIRVIYGKLGVNTREDAVARAVALGLLGEAARTTDHVK